MMAVGRNKAKFQRHRAVAMPRLDDDVRQALDKMSGSKADAVILACNHAVSGTFIQAAREAAY